MKIFLSAVSSEFKSCRDALASDLRAVGAEVVVQEDFQQHGHTLLEKLESYIAGCDRVIALVGNAYGWEPQRDTLAPNMPRRSYTQWEYFFAQGERLDGTRHNSKDLFVYFASPAFLRSNQAPEAAELAELQQKFINHIKASDKDRSTFGSLEDLRVRVLRDGFRLPKRVDRPVYLPDYKPPNFVGRRKYLELLRAALVVNEGKFLLTGEPGTGKSTLALRFAWEAQKDFDAVVFQICGERSIEVIARDLAKQLAPQLDAYVAASPPAEIAKCYKRMAEEAAVITHSGRCMAE